jgi:Holliday junction resolvasome RuvABC endonuclease subunit
MRATRNVITTLIDQYVPTVLAYEQSVYVQQVSSTLLRAVEHELQVTAKTAGLRVIAYSPASVRQSLCGEPWSTKHMVAARLVERFPELERYRIGQSARSERYRLNMFDALAVAVVAVRQLDGGSDGQDRSIMSRAA